MGVLGSRRVRAGVLLAVAVVGARANGAWAGTGQASNRRSSELVGTYLGGRQDDYAAAVARGQDGSIYVVGQTFSPGFPVTPGAFDTTYNAGRFGGDVFVSELSPDGSKLVWSTFLGGTDTDAPAAIAVGPNGQVYVAGFTYATDFPTTPGSYSPSFNGGCCDGFITELTPDGGGLVFSTFLGGDSVDEIGAMAVGRDGTIHVTGETMSADFPTTANAYDRQINDDGQELSSDAFVAELAPDGTGLAHSTFLGGQYNDWGNAIAVGLHGLEYATGFAQSRDFPTTAGAFQPGFGSGNNDAFVSVVSPTGRRLLWSTYLGGGDDDEGDGLAVGPSGSAYVTGSTSSAAFPVTPGAYDTTINSFVFSDAFAVKLSPDGAAETYGTFTGGVDTDVGSAEAVGSNGSASIVGTTYSGDFPTTPGALSSSMGGPADAFVIRVSPSGSSLSYGTFLGGTAGVIDAGFALRSLGPRALDVVGETHSGDFPVTTGAYDTTFNGGFDAFIATIGGVTGP